MCGVISMFCEQEPPLRRLRKAVEQMAERGPDATGEWVGEHVFLGHRRLAILDLDPRACQPMHSACERYSIVYNGEIYNFRSLRQELEEKGVLFRTASDTEVILALFAQDGPAMLPRLHGMFAFIIWDHVDKRAFAARDPYGIKPLYAAHVRGGVLLGSQVKALLSTGLVSREPDPHGQAGFWMLGSVPEPHTWYRDIQAVPAGHCLWIEGHQIVRQWCWHDIGRIWREAGWSKEPAASREEIQAAVRAALNESVTRHLVADVPVGVFLSGGVDSSAVAAMMLEAGARDLQGVTIAYDEFKGKHEDEAPVAAGIAAHYGIRHHVRRVSREEFLSDLPRILAAMDQPSIDGVNTWYASKAVAELGLKVVVSGVGGDELFLGYESFRRFPRLVRWWRLAARFPGTLSLAGIAAEWQARRSRNQRWQLAPDLLQSIGGAWWLQRSIFSPTELPALMGADLAAEALTNFRAGDWLEKMSGALASDETLALAQIESTTYLRNQLLRDSDWASMDHSVELRTPLVDTALLSAVQAYLPDFKHYSNKMLLAKAPTRPLPEDIMTRRKTGFGVPVAHWISESSRDGARLRDHWVQHVVDAYAAA